VITLVRVELRRILSRRVLRLVGVLAMVGILTGSITLFVRSHRLSPEQFRVVQAQAAGERARAVLDCSGGIPAAEVPPGETPQTECEQRIGGPGVTNPAFPLIHIRDVLLGVDGFVIVLLLLLSAAFIGAEWHSGSMTVLLTWEPRRARVFVAKVAAAAIFAFVATLIVLAFLALALLPAAVFRGETSGADGRWVVSTIELVLRAGLMGSVAAIIGLAVASLGRNTAAALGAAFVYFAIFEPFLRALKPHWQQWLLGDNVATFLLAHTPEGASFTRSPTIAALWLGLVALALAGVSGLAFQQRDVT
jgi:ABC-type transport system involved in multi-copper enzyme maturation permease subunit